MAETNPKAETKAETKAEEKARTEAEAKVITEAKAKAKAEADAKAKIKAEEKANAEIEAEAKLLGIEKTRTSVAGSRVKDKAAEAAKHEKKAVSRLSKAIAIKKAEAKMTPVEKRKRLLLARLNNPNNQYTREQLRQFKAELHAIKTGQWFEPYDGDDGKKVAWKVPSQPSNYDKFMAT